MVHGPGFQVQGCKKGPYIAGNAIVNTGSGPMKVQKILKDTKQVNFMVSVLLRCEIRGVGVAPHLKASIFPLQLYL